MAKEIGVSESAICRYIAGLREPKPYVLASIAIALDVTSDYLLGIDNGEFNYNRVRRLIAINASYLTKDEKNQ